MTKPGGYEQKLKAECSKHSLTTRKTCWPVWPVKI